MKHRLALRVALMLVVVGVLAGVVFTWLRLSAPSPQVFDLLVTKDLTETGCTDLVPFTISRVHGDRHLHYRVDLHLDTTDPELFSQIDIWVKRASSVPRHGGAFISPMGGGDSSVVRTADGRYDIIVEQANHGKDGVKSPVIYSRKIAGELARRYAARDAS